MTLRNQLVLASSLAVLTAAWMAHARLVDAGDLDVGFLAVGPAGMKIRGSAPSLKANEQDKKIKVTVPVTNLETGIKLRNKHLRRYLEADKFPNATLVVGRGKLKFPEGEQSVEARATGDFTLHGVTKPLAFTYRAKRTGSDYHVQALADIDIRNFKVEVPCYLGVCVEPNIKLKVKFKLREAAD
ncbi:MAG TPA: YceI family protein [Polyangiaceae bacterium]|jgi:polyisoprenoid-binding protein YceI